MEVVLGVIIGWALNFVSDAVRRWWGRKDSAEAQAAERKLEMARQSREAAQQVLDLLRRVNLEFRRAVKERDLSRTNLETLLDTMRRHYVLIGDEEVRKRIKAVADVMGNAEEISHRDPSEQSISGVVLHASWVGAESLGAFLRGERMPELPRTFRSFVNTMHEVWVELEAEFGPS